MHPSFPASKQHIHPECLFRHCIVFSLPPGNYNITSARLLPGVHPEEMAVALHSADPLGYWHPIRSRAGFFPSLFCNRLFADGSRSDQKVDDCMFHWPMDSRRTPVDSRFGVSEIGRTLQPEKACVRLYECFFRHHVYFGHDCGRSQLC